VRQYAPLFNYGINQMPEFAAWSHENLAKFAEESYVRLREQQEALEQATANFKDAMVELRKLNDYCASLELGNR
jgi:hypothetical protein